MSDRRMKRPAPAYLLRGAAVLLGVVLVLLSLPANAEPLRPRALSDVEVSRRISFIESRLGRGTAAAARWWYGWYAGYTVLTVAQASLAVSATSPGPRAQMAVGAVTSALGVLPLGVFPFEPLTAAAELKALPGATPAERRAKLARAEHLLKASADAEELGQGWITHALGIAVNLGAGAVLALGDDGFGPGVTTFLSGVVVSEVQIFTTPTAAIDDWNEYLKKVGGAHGFAAPASGLSSWTLVPNPGGLSFLHRF